MSLEDKIIWNTLIMFEVLLVIIFPSLTSILVLMFIFIFIITLFAIEDYYANQKNPLIKKIKLKTN